MAYQTGHIKYRESFKSIRLWKNTKDPKIYAGEKGGANRDLILKNPAFARTRENMSELENTLTPILQAGWGNHYCEIAQPRPVACYRNAQSEEYSSKHTNLISDISRRS